MVEVPTCHAQRVFVDLRIDDWYVFDILSKMDGSTEVSILKMLLRGFLSQRRRDLVHVEWCVCSMSGCSSSQNGCRSSTAILCA